MSSDIRGVLNLGQALLDADLPVPQRYRELRSRLNDWNHRQDSETPRLVAALLNTDKELGDIGPVVAGAMAETATGNTSEGGKLNTTVLRALGDAMLAELVAAAPKLYAVAAERFDALAKEAVGYWSITSPNATADSLIAPGVTDEARAAYHSGQMIGLKLEEAVAPLIQAARTCEGAGHLTVPFDGRTDGWQNRIPTAWAGLSLVVQPPEDDAQRAKILDTWRSPRDGSRFYRLYELGCRFSSIKDPAKAVEFAGVEQAATAAPRRLPDGVMASTPNGEYVINPYMGR